MSGARVWLDSVVNIDFGLCCTVAAAASFFSALLCNVYNRRWGEINDFALAMTTACSAVAGLKAIVWALALERATLGALADDRAIFCIGGALATALSLRETFRSWHRAAGFVRSPSIRQAERTGDEASHWAKSPANRPANH